MALCSAGLDIDTKRNLVAIDSLCGTCTPRLWIYSGCDRVCTVVGGPFPLRGESIYGHLNHKGNVCQYSVNALTYQYGINNA